MLSDLTDNFGVPSPKFHIPFPVSHFEITKISFFHLNNTSFFVDTGLLSTLNVQK